MVPPRNYFLVNVKLAHWTSGSLTKLLKLRSYIDAPGRVGQFIGEVGHLPFQLFNWLLANYCSLKFVLFLVCNSTDKGITLCISMVWLVVNAGPLQCKRWLIASHPVSLFLGYILDVCKINPTTNLPVAMAMGFKPCINLYSLLIYLYAHFHFQFYSGQC